MLVWSTVKFGSIVQSVVPLRADMNGTVMPMTGWVHNASSPTPGSGVSDAVTAPPV